MKIDAILSRLERARQTGRDSWIASCPAHEDRHPSMTLRELDDGRILAHCFGGCSIEAILGALGLEFDALFPEKPIERGKPMRRPFPSADVLQCLEAEAAIVALSSIHLRTHGALSDEAHARLMLAEERIEDARRIANG